MDLRAALPSGRRAVWPIGARMCSPTWSRRWFLRRTGWARHARVLDNPDPRGGPLLLAHRHEGAGLPTVLTYGHADVVLAEPLRWRAGLDPWPVTVEGDRWYGRGTADNKGQHTINLAALEQVLARPRRAARLQPDDPDRDQRGIRLARAAANSAPGTAGPCRRRADRLGRAAGGGRAADRLPRLARLGGVHAAGARCASAAYHSGNWGGLLRNPATVLASAVACLVDARGRILVPGLRPPPIPAAVRAALATIPSRRRARRPGHRRGLG